MLEEEMFTGRPHTVGNMRRFLGGNGVYGFLTVL